jgi:hypothetical protein
MTPAKGATMSTTTTSDITVVQDLAKRYVEVAARPEQTERRRLWRNHNSHQFVRPLIYVRAFAFREIPQSRGVCRDPVLRSVETELRRLLFWASVNDDCVFEPWLTVPAVHRCTGWGVETPRQFSEEPRGAFKVDYPIKRPEDLEKLRPPRHEIDEEETARKARIVGEALDGILDFQIDRGPAYRMWHADISTDLGYLRGIEHFMLDMVDNPEWLHRLLAFMRDGVLRAQQQAEDAGDWSLINHQNQAMPYAQELQDPAPHAFGIKRRQLWCFMAAQEMNLISPHMHNDFVLEYQVPILEHFGLIAYGCCEDLSNKIDVLRRIPNLRRIAVSPFADVKRSVEHIGTDYIISYRPSPADMVSYGFNEERIRSILRRDFDVLQGTHFDITLKDVETVQKEPERISRWVQIVREEIDRAF